MATSQFCLGLLGWTEIRIKPSVSSAVHALVGSFTQFSNHPYKMHDLYTFY